MTAAEAHIAVDLEDPTDEDYQSGFESDTTSLASSILNYQYENGRRYHAYRAGSYAMPNDETEQERFVWSSLTLTIVELKVSCVDWTSCITSITCC
jgi:hypothetical protein